MTQHETPPEQLSNDSSGDAAPGSRDLLLEALVISVNSVTGLSIGVILYFGGMVLSGTLISSTEWIREWTTAIEDAGPPLGSGLLSVIEAGTGGDVRKVAKGFVHLRDVAFRNGSLSGTCKLWRGAIDQLNGWSLDGKMDTAMRPSPFPATGR